MAKEITSIEDLQPDPHNLNTGSERGTYAIATSLERYGAGRSILVDKEGVVIAGNKTLQEAVEKGFQIRTVKTSGEELVVVQRTDLDIDSAQGRGLALADNRASEVSLNWSTEELAALNTEFPEEVGAFFVDWEIEVITNAQDLIDADGRALWGDDMPAFEQEDQSAMQTIKVHLATKEDRAAFAAITGQTITEKTKYIWYPAKERTPYPMESELHES